MKAIWSGLALLIFCAVAWAQETVTIDLGTHFALRDGVGTLKPELAKYRLYLCDAPIDEQGKCASSLMLVDVTATVRQGDPVLVSYPASEPQGKVHARLSALRYPNRESRLTREIEIPYESDGTLSIVVK